MSKKKKIRRAYEEANTTKDFFVKYVKRYGIILLISAPIAMIFNFIMSQNVQGYTSAVSFFVALAIILLACFVGLIIYTKKDDKQKLETTPEKERDPFAD